VLRNVEALWDEKNRAGSPLHIHAKTINFDLSGAHAESFRSDFSPVVDSIHIDTPMRWSRSTTYDFALGSDPATDMTGHTTLSEERVVCPHLFYSMAINHDGQVSACCVDWSRNLIVGDCRTDRVTDIWAGASLRELRLLHLGAERGHHPVCGDCQYMQGASEASALDRDRHRLADAYSG
jgi:radical SAM protein with 4Fe4S-binding SPASM domain